MAVNTEKPQTALDVNGDINIKGKIYTEGTDLALGNPGTKNEALTSQGPDQPVTWKEIKIPKGYEGGLYLTTLNVLSDKTGLNLEEKGAGTYLEEESLSGNWVEIPSLRNNFTVSKPNNKVHIILQTTAQINFEGTGSFACGIFIDNKLAGTRVDVVRGPAGSYNVFNLNSSIENKSTGVHSMKVACRARTFVGGTSSSRLSIGAPNDITQLGSDMAQSTLNVYVLESM